MSNKDNMRVATEIYRQLGGSVFKLFTGSDNFVAGKDFLSMKLKRNLTGANYLKIILTPMDVYRLEFIRIHGHSYKIVKEYNDIYCDQLVDIFESETGLYTKF